MAAVVLDIETVGEDFDALDAATQDSLTRWIKKEAADDQDKYQAALADLKDGLGFSPLTGQIVAIGVLDLEKEKGAVYYQAPGSKESPSQVDGIAFKPMTEVEMLQSFWDGAKQYQEFVTFNGRGFDVPFLIIRSAIHGIRPSKDLLSNRYLNSQKFDAKHVDLFDQLTFYGAVYRNKGSLHLWSRAFGITSPKDQGVTGDQVAGLFRAGKFLDIARYNVGDLRATAELYRRWKQFVQV